MRTPGLVHKYLVSRQVVEGASSMQRKGTNAPYIAFVTGASYSKTKSFNYLMKLTLDKCFLNKHYFSYSTRKT